MAAATKPIFLTTADSAAVTFVNADGTTPKSLVTVDSWGGRVLLLVATSDDTAVVDLQVFLQIAGSGTNHLLGTVRVAIGAGNTYSVAPEDILAGLNRDTDGSLPMGSSDVLKVAPKAAVTAAKTVWITAQYGSY